MSIEIITFEAGCPKVSEEAQKREAELDARIEGLIKGTVLSLIKHRVLRQEPRRRLY